MTTMKTALRTGVLLEMAWSDAALAPGEREDGRPVEGVGRQLKPLPGQGP